MVETRPGTGHIPLGHSPPRPGGYPQLSAFVASSPSHTFQIFRRFGALNARCLLYLQDELCELEHDLEHMDTSEYDSGTRRFDQHPERAAKIKLITAKITEYSEYFLKSNRDVKLMGYCGQSTLQHISSYWFTSSKQI